MFEYQVGNIQIESIKKISSEDLELFKLHLVGNHTRNGSPLSGRGTPSHIGSSAFGPIVVKQYRRGGVIRHINPNLYLGFGSESRAEIEFKILTRMRELGVSVPEPLAYAITKGFIYKTWLFTRAVDGGIPLTEVALNREEMLSSLLTKVVSEVDKLIRNRWLHVDLHPGNVLVSKDNEVFIIDFDKARTVEEDASVLRNRYICRWRRAVIKHHLPEILAELFTLGLRAKY